MGQYWIQLIITLQFLKYKLALLESNPGSSCVSILTDIPPISRTINPLVEIGLHCNFCQDWNPIPDTVLDIFIYPVVCRYKKVIIALPTQNFKFPHNVAST